MNVVLVEPEIHFNTGNIGRTCVAAGAVLHLVRPLGFSLDDRRIRRSGLDYWPKLRLVVHEDWRSYLASLPPGSSLILFSARARRSYLEAPFQPDSHLLFGRESSGLPEALRRRFARRLYRIPTTSDVRSLNLSTAAGIALYEALRRTGTLP